MIKTISEYQELALMADVAEESLNTLRFGNHYLLISKLREMHGIVTDRTSCIKQARKLCDEFITAYNTEDT